jgi:hypothetical protein
MPHFCKLDYYYVIALASNIVILQDMMSRFYDLGKSHSVPRRYLISKDERSCLFHTS